ncbi:MAG: hypothetical protein HY535_01150, partial [Chloroflexi bacterium]|nr:hypothetical protein [Chloroflexota bacterium]
SPAGVDPDNPSDVVVQAYAGADAAVIMSWYPDLHSRKLGAYACVQHQTKQVSMYQLATFDVLSSPAARFPIPLMFEIMRRMANETHGRQIRITNELGTDLVVKAPPQMEKMITGIAEGLYTTDVAAMTTLRKGFRSHFPPAVLGFVPIDGYGVFYPNETVITGPLTEPVKVTVEGRYITNIEGGEQAEALKAFINGPGKTPGPKPLVEAMWGLSPKARLHGANATQVERERHAGTLHLGIATYQYQRPDLNLTGWQETGDIWPSHVDCFLETPSMWFDGELLVDRRKLLLLEDPAIREMARQFGDPDELLKPGTPYEGLTC